MAEDVGYAGLLIALVRLLDPGKRITLKSKEFLTLIFQLLLFFLFHNVIFFLIQLLVFHLVPSVQGALHLQERNSSIGIGLKHVSQKLDHFSAVPFGQSLNAS